MEHSVIEKIALFISSRTGFSYEIPTGLRSPAYAYNERRKQYDAKQILEHLDRGNNAQKILAVTDVDLYVPILKYIFGLARVGGTSTVISIHRLHPRFYNAPPDEAILLDRIKKTALHELGHSFGLTHCRSKHCVMFSSTRISDTDLKKDAFCPTCADLFSWYAERDSFPAPEKC